MSGDHPVNGRATAAKLLVDGHVYFHECVTWGVFGELSSVKEMVRVQCALRWQRHRSEMWVAVPGRRPS